MKPKSALFDISVELLNNQNASQTVTVFQLVRCEHGQELVTPTYMVMTMIKIKNDRRYKPMFRIQMVQGSNFEPDTDNSDRQVSFSHTRQVRHIISTYATITSLHILFNPYLTL